MLAAAGLAVGYAGHTVGEGFRFTLGPGEVLALLGPNGGGKTTLLKTLLGLLAPRAGAVTLDGRPLSAWPARERARRLAYVPQASATGFAYSVEDLVMMGRSAHRGLFASPGTADRAAVTDAIARLGLQALARRPTTQISGGERQLALIARALAQDARVVVLDEPTASLDFGNQGRVLSEIRRLAAAGLGVLFTTHDPNHALRVADRALLLRRGGPLALGPVHEVLVSDRLQTLYGVPVETVPGPGGPGAFLPTLHT